MLSKARVCSVNRVGYMVVMATDAQQTRRRRATAARAILGEVRGTYVFMARLVKSKDDVTASTTTNQTKVTASVVTSFMIAP
jgi:hypothetical protein